MKDFQYQNLSKIVFGAESEKHLETLLVENNATSLLLVYSGDFIKDLGIWDIVKNTCSKHNIKFLECSKVVPNPKVELVRELVDLGKKEQVDFILAVGGGSAIDTSKAVAIGIPYEGDVWDFFEDKSTNVAVPIGVITTLPASGSETSNCSIISNGLLKHGFEDDCIIPKFAIMNPTFTLGLPNYQTSCGVADILSHLLERYFTNEKHVDTTDFLIEGAIKALTLNGLRLMDNPKDYNARAEIQWLASIAHNNLLDTGRVADWGSHRIEHEVSAQYGVTHGEGMAVILIAWTKYMSKHNPHKLAQLCNRIYGVDYLTHTEEEMAIQLSNNLCTFFKQLNLKTSLTELNITDVDFKEMANRATNNNTSTVGNYIPLDFDKIIEILYLAI